MNYISVTEWNGYRIKIRNQLIGKILLNIMLRCALALFHATRRPCLLTETAKDGNRKIKAAIALHMKHQKIQFVHDDQERCMSQPQEVQRIIEQHFLKHFNKENINHIKKFITGAKTLKRKITAKEVKAAVWKMTNNKAPDKDNNNVELIKYAPEEIYKEIANILNGIYERNDTGIKSGTSILLPIQKPKKTQGPVKNLRPITLLEVIRKILSKIFMDRTEDKINKHLSQSQSAYRKFKSTTDGPTGR